MTQQEIAKKLGISQSAVSRYISGERGLPRELLKSMPEIENEVAKLTDKIIEGASMDEITNEICRFCLKMRRSRISEVF